MNCDALAKLYDVELDDLIHYDQEQTGESIPPKGKHIFGTVRVGERGQIVLPKQARDVFKIKPGDLLVVLGDESIEHPGIAIMKEEYFLGIAQLFKTALNMLILTFVTGTVVISLLLCMWTRTRQKEMAVFISMGERKIKIFLQAILESVTLFLISGIASCGLGIYAAGWLQKMLVSSSSDQISLQISLQVQDMAVLLSIGGAVVLIAVFLAVFPILKTSPREILSRMEG